MSRLWSLTTIVVLTLCSATVAAEPNSLTPDEIRDGWILLFDGETLFGWEPTTKANWAVANGVISASEGEKDFLNTTSEFADYAIRVDFRCPETTNSGVFLRTHGIPKDTESYELNIATEAVSPFPTGSLVKREKGRVPAYSPDWHTYEVTAEAGHIVVKVDGETTLDYNDPQPIPRGRISLQFNVGKVEFRNLKLKPLGLKPLFNGKDLSGWKEYPGKQSSFSVVDGEIDIKNGPGALENESQFGDFVLQLEAKTNGKDLNSGVFFRSIPGEYTNGYESQIHNGFKDGDRNKPTDGGTGGIFRRQDARRVVANDFEWFTKTIVATGPHLAVWVNGYPVSHWTDDRKQDENPRKGLRLKAGTIQLQGHDATTDLRFRNLRAVEVPK
jgi:hypothetical protein